MKGLGILVLVVVAIASALYTFRNSLLRLGASKGNTNVMSLAFKFKADKNAYAADGATPLIIAANSGKLESVQRLIGEGADVNRKHRDTGFTPLMAAAQRGDASIVDALLEAGAAIETRDGQERTAYAYAWEANHLDVARKVRYVKEVEPILSGLEDQSATTGKFQAKARQDAKKRDADTRTIRAVGAAAAHH